MYEYEPDKFIVINRKIIKKLPTEIQYAVNGIHDHNNNKYHVCNQDEPYAQKVKDVILEGEREKELYKNATGELAAKNIEV